MERKGESCIVDFIIFVTLKFFIFSALHANVDLQKCQEFVVNIVLLRLVENNNPEANNLYLHLIGHCEQSGKNADITLQCSF